MSRVSTYLNFEGNTEDAFNFYKSVFKTEFIGEINRIGGGPTMPGMPELSAADKNKIMHIALPILGGHVIMGTDNLQSMGHPPLVFGTNASLNLEPDTRAETEQLFQALAAGGKTGMPLTDMFWGAYFGYLTDKFGVQWMFNCMEPKK